MTFIEMQKMPEANSRRLENRMAWGSLGDTSGQVSSDLVSRRGALAASNREQGLTLA